MKILTVSMPNESVCKLDKLVSERKYASRSELVRVAIRDQLFREIAHELVHSLPTKDQPNDAEEEPPQFVENEKVIMIREGHDFYTYHKVKKKNNGRPKKKGVGITALNSHHRS